MIFFMALLLAVWFKRELRYFPLKINRQIYHDYQALCAAPINFEAFQMQSTLQPHQSKLGYSLYLLFPLITLCFNEKSTVIIVILILLAYLSALDILYYLTDIDYISLIFLLSISHLLFSENIEAKAHLLTLFSTAVFFSLFSGLLKLISPSTMFGSGDILLLIALSPLFRLEEMLQFLLYASLSGILYSLFSRVWFGRKLEKLPFIPFITLGFSLINR